MGNKIKVYTRKEFYKELPYVYKEWMRKYQSTPNMYMNYQDYKLLYFSNSNMREKVIEDYLKEMKWTIRSKMNDTRNG